MKCLGVVYMGAHGTKPSLLTKNECVLVCLREGCEIIVHEKQSDEFDRLQLIIIRPGFDLGFDPSTIRHPPGSDELRHPLS
jgi:hypothetical protein